MRELVDVALGGLMLGCLALLVLTGPITLVLVAFLMPVLVPLASALLIPAALIGVVAGSLRRLLG